MEIIGNKRGNDILFTIRDDKEVAGACAVEIVLPSRTWEDTWLRAGGTGGLSFGIGIYRVGFYVLRLGLLVQDYSHSRDGQGEVRCDGFNEGSFNRGVIGRIGSRGDWRCDRYAVMEMRGRNRKWFRTGDWRTVGVSWVNVVFKFCSRVLQCRGGMNTFIIVDIIERCTYMSQHEHVRSKNGSRSGRCHRLPSTYLNSFFLFCI